MPFKFALRCVPVMVAAACALPAFAQEIDCENALAQQEINRCAHMHFEEADAELNRIYAKVIAQAKIMDRDLDTATGRPVGAEAAVRAAQRAWITYRDAHCNAAAAHSRGGSMEPMLVSGCMAWMTEDRTQQLKDLLLDFGG